jgi:hypothetical protein
MLFARTFHLSPKTTTTCDFRFILDVTVVSGITKWFCPAKWLRADQVGKPRIAGLSRSKMAFTTLITSHYEKNSHPETVTTTHQFARHQKFLAYRKKGRKIGWTRWSCGV